MDIERLYIDYYDDIEDRDRTERFDQFIRDNMNFESNNDIILYNLLINLHERKLLSDDELLDIIDNPFPRKYIKIYEMY